MCTKDPEIAIRQTIEGEWLSVSPVVVGSPESDLRTPDFYVLAHHTGHGRVRVDVYRNTEDASCFEDVRLVEHVLVIGCGCRVHFVRLDEGRAVTSHDLGSYFGSLLELAESVLVASAERVFRFTPRGGLLWRSDVVGIDGVIIDDVNDEQILGSGEWDPPGGWRPFSIDLATGVKGG